MTKKTVATRTKPQTEHEEALKQNRALVGGTILMRKASTRLLPKDPKESDDDYGVRKRMSFLFPAFDKTINDLADMVFEKEVTFSEDAPKEIVGDNDNSAGEVKTPGWVEDIDMLGRNFNNFGRELLVDGLAAGINYVYVDMPKGKEGATMADEQKPGFRPFVTHLKYEDVIGWKTARVDDVLVLAQIRFWEEVQEEDPEDEFNQKTIKQIRVIDRVDTPEGDVAISWRIFRKRDGRNQGEEYVIHDFGAYNKITQIPVVPIYYRRTGFFTGKPVMQHLSDLNVQHWQSASDQSNILHFARVPFLFGSGFTTDGNGKITVAVKRFTYVSDPNAKLGWVEHEGKAIEAGDKDLKNIEMRMQVLGLQMVTPQNNAKTATSDMLDKSKTVTHLGMIADSIKDGLENVLKLMAEFKQIEGGERITVVINKEFGIDLKASDIGSIISMANAGLITKETALKEAQRRQVIAADIDPKTEIEEVKEQRDEDDPLGVFDKSSSGSGPPNDKDKKPGGDTDVSSFISKIQGALGKKKEAA